MRSNCYIIQMPFTKCIILSRFGVINTLLLLLGANREVLSRNLLCGGLAQNCSFGIRTQRRCLPTKHLEHNRLHSSGDRVDNILNHDSGFHPPILSLYVHIYSLGCRFKVIRDAISTSSFPFRWRKQLQASCFTEFTL